MSNEVCFMMGVFAGIIIGIFIGILIWNIWVEDHE